MKTSKPFATISYNSSKFLETKLNELVVTRKIDFFAFVNHYAEEDEKKDHKHLYIVPNGQINTDSVTAYLLEPDSQNPLSAPLGCMPCKPSKFADWYLYSKHDKDYLASKGQSRRYSYALEDFISSNNDYLLEEIHTIDFSALNRSKALKDAVSYGLDFSDLVVNGQIPLQQIKAYEYAYNIFLQKTYRNGRETHTPKDTNETENS